MPAGPGTGGATDGIFLSASGPWGSGLAAGLAASGGERSTAGGAARQGGRDPRGRAQAPQSGFSLTRAQAASGNEEVQFLAFNEKERKRGSAPPQRGGPLVIEAQANAQAAHARAPHGRALAVRRGSRRTGQEAHAPALDQPLQVLAARHRSRRGQDRRQTSILARAEQRGQGRSAHRGSVRAQVQRSEVPARQAHGQGKEGKGGARIGARRAQARQGKDPARQAHGRSSRSRTRFRERCWTSA